MLPHPIKKSLGRNSNKKRQGAQEKKKKNFDNRSNESPHMAILQQACGGTSPGIKSS